MSKKKRAPTPPKKSNNTLIYTGLAILVIAAVGFIILNNNTAPETPGKVPTEGKFIKLNKPSTYEPGKVKIVEFMKFRCGHCYALNQYMPELKKKYGDKLEIIYKPMLWRSVPQDLVSKKSIEAYILAERMGKGEEMKDALFKAMIVDKKDISSQFVLIDIAKSVGLGDDFATALEKGDAKDEAEANINFAESFEVGFTPTLIINGNLKVDPTLTNEDTKLMNENLDKIISSLLT